MNARKNARQSRALKDDFPVCARLPQRVWTACVTRVLPSSLILMSHAWPVALPLLAHAPRPLVGTASPRAPRKRVLLTLGHKTTFTLTLLLTCVKIEP